MKAVVPQLESPSVPFEAETSLSSGFLTDCITLYQPNEVLEKRLLGAETLSAYIPRMQAVAGDFFATANTPETLHIVVAVRPGRRSRVWLLSTLRAGTATVFALLRQKLEGITPVEVRVGPVAFAISATIAGGNGEKPRTNGDLEPPIPQEWEDPTKALKAPVLVPDGFLDAVWPSSE